MVSFHTHLSPTRRNTITGVEDSTKKRKWEDPQVEVPSEKPVKAKSTKSIFDMEIHLETPLPLEWQRCLDIRSGQIHYYNMRTQKRTSKDPRTGLEPPSPGGHMSLDLELNLPCGSSKTKTPHVGDNFTKNIDSGTSSDNSGGGGDHLLNSGRDEKNSGGLTLCPPWLAFEGDQKEMITAVCKRCHMLVMMCKSSPACPNCKFMHPPDQSPNVFNPRLSLLC